MVDTGTLPTRRIDQFVWRFGHAALVASAITEGLRKNRHN